jgi:hypothetical protein
MNVHATHWVKGMLGSGWSHVSSICPPCAAPSLDGTEGAGHALGSSVAHQYVLKPALQVTAPCSCRPSAAGHHQWVGAWVHGCVLRPSARQWVHGCVRAETPQRACIASSPCTGRAVALRAPCLIFPPPPPSAPQHGHSALSRGPANRLGPFQPPLPQPSLPCAQVRYLQGRCCNASEQTTTDNLLPHGGPNLRPAPCLLQP